MRLVISFLWIAGIGLAESWSGYLVDSNCWSSRQNNTNSVSTTVDRDMGMDLRYCSPTAKTVEFGLVLYDWRMLKLDANGNENAAELARHATRPAALHVRINGVQSNRTITGGSILPAPKGH